MVAASSRRRVIEFEKEAAGGEMRIVVQVSPGIYRRRIDASSL
jgi:hypothetical protein